jgi:hypothetical protein
MKARARNAKSKEEQEEKKMADYTFRPQLCSPPPPKKQRGARITLSLFDDEIETPKNADRLVDEIYGDAFLKDHESEAPKTGPTNS